MLIVGSGGVICAGPLEGGYDAVERDDYSFADDRRAGLIAKTESYRAANYANLQARQKSGVVQTVKWFTAEDDNVCPQCEALDGKTVDIGSDFFQADYGDGNPATRSS